MPPVNSKPTNQDVSSYPGPAQRTSESLRHGGRPILTSADTKVFAKEVDINLSNFVCYLEPYHRDVTEAWLDTVIQVSQGFGTIFKPGAVPLAMRVAVNSAPCSAGERKPVDCDLSHGSQCTVVFDNLNLNESFELTARQVPQKAFHDFMIQVLKPSEQLQDIFWPVKLGTFERITDKELKSKLRTALSAMTYEVHFTLENMYLLEDQQWSVPVLKRSVITWVPMELLEQVNTLERNHPNPSVSISDRVVACCQLNAARRGREGWIQMGQGSVEMAGYPGEDSSSSSRVSSRSGDTDSGRRKKKEEKVNNKTSPFKNFVAHGTKEKVTEKKPFLKEKFKPKPPGIMASVIKIEPDDSPATSANLTQKMNDLELKTPGRPKFSSTPGTSGNLESSGRTPGGRKKITPPERTGKKGSKDSNGTPSIEGRRKEGLLRQVGVVHGPKVGDVHYEEFPVNHHRTVENNATPLDSRRQSPGKRRAGDIEPREDDSPKRVIAERDGSADPEDIKLDDLEISRLTRRLSREYDDIESEDDFGDETYRTALEETGGDPLMSSTLIDEIKSEGLEKSGTRIVRLLSRSRSRSKSRPPSPVSSRHSSPVYGERESSPIYSRTGDTSNSDRGEDADNDLDPDATMARRVERRSTARGRKDPKVSGVKVEVGEITPEVAARVIVNTGKPLKPGNSSTRNKKKNKKDKKNALTHEGEMPFQEKVIRWENQPSSPIIVRKKTKDKKERSLLKELAKHHKVKKIKWDNPDEENFSVLFHGKDRRIQVKALALKIRDLSRQKIETKRRLRQILAHAQDNEDENGYQRVDVEDGVMDQIDVLDEDEDLSDLEDQVNMCAEIMGRLQREIKEDKLELAEKIKRNRAMVRGAARNDEGEDRKVDFVPEIPSAPSAELLSLNQVQMIRDQGKQNDPEKMALNANLNAPEQDFVPNYDPDTRNNN